VASLFVGVCKVAGNNAACPSLYVLLSKRCILAAGGAHALSVSPTCWLLACGVSSFGALLHQDNMLRSWLQVTSRLQVRRSKRAGVRETVALLASFSDGQPDKEETGANQVQKAATGLVCHTC
jgi:hypothetical protein